MNKPRWFFRAFTYARRAHSIYFGIMLSQLTNSIIYYRLLIEHVPPLNALFPHYWLFFIIFTTIYSVIATVIGWWDYHKGSVQTDDAIHTLNSPVQQDIINASILAQQGLLNHCSGDDEAAMNALNESIKKLRRWVDEK